MNSAKLRNNSWKPLFVRHFNIDDFIFVNIFIPCLNIIQNRATLNYFGLQGENSTEEEGNTAKGMS